MIEELSDFGKNMRVNTKVFGSVFVGFKGRGFDGENEGWQPLVFL